MNLLNKLDLLKKRGEELKAANILGAKQAAINFGEAAVDLMGSLTEIVDTYDFDDAIKIKGRLERIERLSGLYIEAE